MRKIWPLQFTSRTAVERLRKHLARYETQWRQRVAPGCEVGVDEKSIPRPKPSPGRHCLGSTCVVSGKSHNPSPTSLFNSRFQKLLALLRSRPRRRRIPPPPISCSRPATSSLMNLPLTSAPSRESSSPPLFLNRGASIQRASSTVPPSITRTTTVSLPHLQSSRRNQASPEKKVNQNAAVGICLRRRRTGRRIRTRHPTRREIRVLCFCPLTRRHVSI